MASETAPYWNLHYENKKYEAFSKVPPLTSAL